MEEESPEMPIMISVIKVSVGVGAMSNFFANNHSFLTTKASRG
jgi:hypothetical protein